MYGGEQSLKERKESEPDRSSRNSIGRSQRHTGFRINSSNNRLKHATDLSLLQPGGSQDSQDGSKLVVQSQSLYRVDSRTRRNQNMHIMSTNFDEEAEKSLLHDKSAVLRAQNL